MLVGCADVFINEFTDHDVMYKKKGISNVSSVRTDTSMKRCPIRERIVIWSQIFSINHWTGSQTSERVVHESTFNLIDLSRARIDSTCPF